MQSKLVLLFFLVVSLSHPLQTFGNERIETIANLKANGFVPVSSYLLQRGHPDFSTSWIKENSAPLEWPVEFEDEFHTIGQNYLQYQNYGSGAYIHGGCDLRAKGNSDVRTPVAGVIEGGFYGYNVNKDGSMEKYWKPWTGSAKRDPYFELAITTDEGVRYELHHIDSQSLPDSTIAALSKKGSRVPAGLVVGKVNAWAFYDRDYPHIHYNIIRPDGVRINPEYESQKIPKIKPPDIMRVYVSSNKGPLKVFQDKDLVDSNTKFLVLMVNDIFKGNVYQSPPLRVQISYENGDISGFDFTHYLFDPETHFPDIRNIFLTKVQTPDLGIITTLGNWGVGPFVIRVPILPNHQGPFSLIVSDTGGLETRRVGILN